MAFKVRISPQVEKYLKSLDKENARKIKDHINQLKDDPFTPRSQCDIVKEKQ
jgi:mRNA-degrading endonuclease RelE of RelBE toxin-antitoxin system